MLAAVLLPGSVAAQEREPDPPPLVPLRDLGGAIRDFGEDTWAVVSSPTRLDARTGAVVGGVLAVGGALFAMDEEITRRVAVEDPGGFHGTLREVGDFFEPAGLQSNSNLYLAGISAVSYFTRQDWLHAPAKQLLYSQWISGIVRQGTGALVGRQRPSQEESAYVFTLGDGKSFPSGHSSVAMAIATVLSHHIDYAPATVALYAAASAVVFQRVDAGEHWASDAWLGAGLGLAIARIVIMTEESRRLHVGVGPGPGGGLGLSVSVMP